MIIRTFQTRFAPLVEQGLKTQTVRKMPKRMPRVGERISLRMWTGRPYCSKQRVLREAVISKVEKLSIWPQIGQVPLSVWVGSNELLSMLNLDRHRDALDVFARADGFADWNDFYAWLKSTHHLPFEGVVIHWVCHDLIAGEMEATLQHGRDTLSNAASQLIERAIRVEKERAAALRRV